MTLPAIVNTARTLSYYSTLQDITANNLANASSDGYKADLVTAHLTAGEQYPEVFQSINLTQADLRDTGRPLDVGLQGSGFTVVQTPDGERLTRGGSFALNQAGMLVDGQGNAVLGVAGPMVMPNARKITIDPDGTVTADGTVVGKLKLENVADPSTLRKEGNGQFSVTGGASTPAAPADAMVHQGTIEGSNVSALLGSVDMIMIQRAYAASVDALKAMDGVLDTISGEIGRV
ncbi:MAG TPA: flagellar hook basal-body protein [Gemmatimonadales bacterium]|jgi:flagellar basal body rod protein FlgG|nr:flagellar hook basal-body protein [Gemmatimonadales bacterium]